MKPQSSPSDLHTWYEGWSSQPAPNPRALHHSKGTSRPPEQTPQQGADGPTAAKTQPNLPQRAAQFLLHSPARTANGASSPKPYPPGTEPNPLTPTLPKTEPAAAAPPSTNTTGATELFFGQWTKGDHSSVTERPKSGTKSHESGQTETPGAVPATGCLPKQLTSRTSIPQRQLWEECKNTPTRCGSATPSGLAPLGIPSAS